MMTVIVDRFEENFAVCEKEDGSLINIKRDVIPKEVKEGDVLIINKNLIAIDKEETDRRKKEIEKLTEDIWIE